jgi:hypothetical protein
MSTAQQRFAVRRAAIAGGHSPLGGRFFYHHGRDVTWRWLVSDDGLVLQTVGFWTAPGDQQA